MTVTELIAAWSQEERERLAELIAECLQRERTLNLVRQKIRGNEKELGKSLDHLISRLAGLARNAEACNVFLQEIYLKAARPKGSA